jgi:hypothetical protein
MILLAYYSYVISLMAGKSNYSEDFATKKIN